MTSEVRALTSTVRLVCAPQITEAIIPNIRYAFSAAVRMSSLASLPKLITAALKVSASVDVDTVVVGVDVDVPGVFLLCLTFFLVTHHEHCLLLQDTSRPMLAKQLLDKALENLLQVCRPCSLLTSTSRPLPHCRVPLYPGVSLCMCCPGCETRQRYGRDDHCRGESV